MPLDDSTTGAPPVQLALAAALNGLLDVALREMSLELFTGEVCRVTAYKPPTAAAGPVPAKPARVDVELLTTRVLRDGENPDGSPKVVEVNPKYQDCPILLPGFSVAFGFVPDPDGAEALVGQYGFLTGGTNYPAPAALTGEPGKSHIPGLRHSANNGFFVPGAVLGSKLLLAASEAGKLKLGAADGGWGLELTTATLDVALRTTGPKLTLDALTEVLGGEAAVSFLIKDTLVTLMDGMIAAALAAIAVPDGGLAAFTAFQTTWNATKSTITTTKLKGE